MKGRVLRAELEVLLRRKRAGDKRERDSRRFGPADERHVVKGLHYRALELDHHLDVDIVLSQSYSACGNE